MRTFSKFAGILAATTLVLAGCGDDTTEPSAEPTEPSGPATSCEGVEGDGPKVGVAYDGAGRGDKSFNDAAWVAIQNAIEDFDITCVEATPSGSDNDAARAERLRTLADSGLNPVVATGYAYTPAVSTVAVEYPETNFAVVDGYTACGKACGLPNDATENMVDLTFAEEQGSFVVGVAAALKSQSKHVGFVGGNTGPLITKFAAGYQAGVLSVDDTIKVDLKFLTEDPSDINKSFYNKPGGKQAAEGMIDAGADVIFQAAGDSGIGAIEAVVEAGEGHWAIGVDSDQYNTVAADQQPFILTSMLKRVDTAIYEFLSAFVDGTPPSGNQVYDIKVDGVGYSTSGGFVDDIADQLNAAVEELKSGAVTAPTTLD